jgi:hypothetical protein
MRVAPPASYPVSAFSVFHGLALGAVIVALLNVLLWSGQWLAAEAQWPSIILAPLCVLAMWPACRSLCRTAAGGGSQEGTSPLLRWSEGTWQLLTTRADGAPDIQTAIGAATQDTAESGTPELLVDLGQHLLLSWRADDTNTLRCIALSSKPGHLAAWHALRVALHARQPFTGQLAR